MAFQIRPEGDASTPLAVKKILSDARPAPLILSPLQEHHLGAQAKPTEVHVAADGDGRLMLCLYAPNTSQLTAISVVDLCGPPSGSGMVVFTAEASSVATVVATRPGQTCCHGLVPMRDVIVLQPDGRIALYAGSMLACYVALEASTAPPDRYAALLGESYGSLSFHDSMDDCNMDEQLRPVGLKVGWTMFR